MLGLDGRAWRHSEAENADADLAFGGRSSRISWARPAPSGWADVTLAGQRSITSSGA